MQKQLTLPISNISQPFGFWEKFLNNKAKSSFLKSDKKLSRDILVRSQKKETVGAKLKTRNETLPQLQRKNLRIGDFCELKITALGPNGVGIDEFSYGYPILIPRAQLGETVKVQIKLFYPLKKAEVSPLKEKNAFLQEGTQKHFYDFKRFVSLSFKKTKYAVAHVLSPLNPPKNQLKTSQDLNEGTLEGKGSTSVELLSSKKSASVEQGVKGGLIVGNLLTVKLDSVIRQTHSLSIGISYYNLSKQFKIIIPLSSDSVPKVGQEIQIKITRVKLNYCFGTIFTPQLAEPVTRMIVQSASTGIQNENHFNSPGLSKLIAGLHENQKDLQLTKGSKMTLTIPQTATQFAKHLVILLLVRKQPLTQEDSFSSPQGEGIVLFLKNSLGSKLGDKVRVKLTKIGSKFAIGKIIRIAPYSSIQKLARARKNINEMLANGMHYGEKVVQCQAKMRSYIWNRKNKGGYKRFAKKSALHTALPEGSKLVGMESNASLKEGKNSPLIKKGRHLINLLKTRRCLNIGLNQLTKFAAKGRTFLFVGTKKPAAGLIARASLFSKTSFFVNTRWLGGMLTNWKTIIKSIAKIRPILKEKQKVITNILQKRAKIQNRLIKKVLSLRKKSKILIKKGKQLIEKVKNLTVNSSLTTNLSGSGFDAKATNQSYPVFYKITLKKTELFERGQFLLQKRQSLLNKQETLRDKTLSLKESGFLIANKYKNLLNQFTATHKKLHDLRLLFILNKELRKITKLAKEQGKTQYTLSYVKAQALKQLPIVVSGYAPKDLQVKTKVGLRPALKLRSVSKKLCLIPNPPQEILNKILATLSYASNFDSPNVSSNSLLGIEKESLTKTSSFKGSLTNRAKNDIGTQSFDDNFLKENFDFGKFIKNDSLTNSQQINKACKTINLLRGESQVKDSKNTPLTLKSHTNKSIILTKLLSKFSRFLPYIKNAISSLLRIMISMEKKMIELKFNLKLLKNKLIEFLLFNHKINAELKQIQTKYTSEQQIIRVLRKKLKRHEAEKKLLQFLPKLRYLPTPKSQISLAIQILMKRFVDPKLKYPMDLIYDEKLRKKSKKVAAARKKKWQRLETYFGGIANMTKLKKTQISNNVAIIIGQQEELNAVYECKKLGIKMFHIVDTNCNPGLADHFIPANDDSRNSIKYLLTKIVTRIRLAQKLRLLKVFKTA